MWCKCKGTKFVSFLFFFNYLSPSLFFPFYSDGETCVYTAVRAGNIHVVKALMDYGVDISSSVNGKTPLDIARQLNDEPLVRLLSGLFLCLFSHIFISHTIFILYLGEDVEITEKAERKKYQKSTPQRDLFWSDDSNRVSMQFCVDDLNELHASENVETHKITSPRKSTASKIKQFVKGSTEPRLGSSRRNTDTMKFDWTPPTHDKKLDTLKKRTQISLGSSRDIR